ncbi:MAG: CYTH domain-containing protein [Lachnospiraceae bacterium]|nr:CYTH domain-containing protein [Lachnospiraceae bacterium]
MEIERKYLIEELPDLTEAFDIWKIEQAYLADKPTLRIRKKNDEYIMTYKNKKRSDETGAVTSAAVNEEIEIPIPESIYEHLLLKKIGHTVKKTRYLFRLDDEHRIELDVFEGRLKGLVMAEVEFKDVADANDFKPPAWFGKEVSDDKRYTNKSLSKLVSLDNLKEEL